MLRKWYFATNVHGIKTAFDQITAAVLSAKKNTSLQARCIFDDHGADEESANKISWIKMQGVEVIIHRSTMLAELEPRFGNVMQTYSGHWLRCDLPLIEKEDEIVIYTDIDVIFLKDVTKFAPFSTLLACGPEHNRDDYRYFNSGIMLMNVRAFGARRGEMLERLRHRLASSTPYDDQGLLNEMFFAEWERLPNEWNWKPYWGSCEQAIILHFHGPKPQHAEAMLQGKRHMFGSDFREIFERNPKGYREALKLFYDFQT